MGSYMDDAVRTHIWLSLLGVAMYLCGIALMIKPWLIRPDTPLYRWIYWRWFAHGKPASKEHLSEQQIRYYAIGMTTTGLLIFALVAWMMLR